MSGGSVQRIGAMVLRYAYLLRRSWPRLVELAYWPTVQMILWGFISRFLMTDSSLLTRAAGLLLSGVLLWDVLFRSQLGVSVVFFEELHSRNLGHLFVSPLRPLELIISLLTISLIRTLIGVGTAAVLALPFYGYNVLDLGLSLIGFFVNLTVMGWAIGLLVAALVLRNGLGAESMAWAAIFALAPVSGIYYPIATLPEWLQYLAWMLPTSYVFEGMRAVLLQHAIRLDFMVYAVVLNAFYLALAIAVFLATFRVARERGLLFQSGE
jgi:ABC-2 type transport system permease protein